MGTEKVFLTFFYLSGVFFLFFFYSEATPGARQIYYSNHTHVYNTGGGALKLVVEASGNDPESAPTSSSLHSRL